MIILPIPLFRNGPLQVDHPSTVKFFQRPWVARLKLAMTVVWGFSVKTKESAFKQSRVPNSAQSLRRFGMTGVGCDLVSRGIS
jgi:hypothetical protein